MGSDTKLTSVNVGDETKEDREPLVVTDSTV